MPSRISSDLLINPGDLTYNFADANQTNLGARGIDQAGNAYRWCLAGASALVPGKLQQAPAQIANHQNLTTATAAIGATSVTVTLGNTAATANQYAGGWIVITAGTGASYRYLISSHPAANALATLVLTLSDAIVVATAVADSKSDLQANPFSGVILNPATASSAPVGAAVTAITAAFYGWVQTRGVAALLADGAITVGTALVASNGTAGAVEPAAGVQAPVGTSLTDIDTTQYGSVYMALP
jgi:hypothetical protein